ncbi:hypothetical protein EJB05_29135, partial [Eragrostis curvula]
MVAKRVRDHTEESPPANCSMPGDNDEVVKSAKQVYLVAPLRSKKPPAHRVFMLEPAAAAAGADGREPRRRRARAVAEFPSGGERHTMSFVVAHWEQRSWIVGVGGTHGDTYIHDPSTAETIQGPELQPKRRPILLSMGGKVYAMSRYPEVRKSQFDFEPWFKSLSLRKGVPTVTGPGYRAWKHLPSPPCFPCLLDPLEYRNPPRVSVKSYAAVASSHILISLDDNNEAGTWAFDVVKKTWEKVSNQGLPFVGQAVPLGGSLFAACYTTNNSDRATAIFDMSIKGSSTQSASGKLATSLLSILEYPVASVEDTLPIFCPTGKGSFCSIWLGPSCQIRKASRHAKKRLKIILTAFKIDSIEDILTACQEKSAEASEGLQVPVQIKHQNQTYKLHGAPTFQNARMPAIALLSM